MTAALLNQLTRNVTFFLMVTEESKNSTESQLTLKSIIYWWCAAKTTKTSGHACLLSGQSCSQQQAAALCGAWGVVTWSEQTDGNSAKTPILPVWSTRSAELLSSSALNSVERPRLWYSFELELNLKAVCICKQVQRYSILISALAYSYSETETVHCPRAFRLGVAYYVIMYLYLLCENVFRKWNLFLQPKRQWRY